MTLCDTSVSSERIKKFNEKNTLAFQLVKKIPGIKKAVEGTERCGGLLKFEEVPQRFFATLEFL